jgi:Ser/Thr protein kinase RdoA (MazF antagonist)
VLTPKELRPALGGSLNDSWTDYGTLAAMPDSDRSSELEQDIFRVVGQWAQPTGSIEDWSWSHGVSSVFKVSTNCGDVVVKRVHRDTSFAREVRALQRWWSHLGQRHGRLLHVEEASRTMVLDRVPGSIATAVGRDRDPLVHHHAGRLVARLHAAEEPIATTSYGEKLLADFDSWSVRARQLVPLRDLDAAREIATAACHLGAVELVPAHRDNSPRNWMVDDQNVVSLIDFGHADNEPWWVDLYRLMHREWLDRPDLRDAFLAGYGRDIDDNTADLLRVYGACGAVSTIAWATEHGDKPFADEGYAQLRRLLGHGR